MALDLAQSALYHADGTECPGDDSCDPAMRTYWRWPRKPRPHKVRVAAPKTTDGRGRVRGLRLRAQMQVQRERELRRASLGPDQDSPKDRQ